MAQCARCSAGTEIYQNNVPVCIRCEMREARLKPSIATKDIQGVLYREVVAATSRAKAASEAFSSAMKVPRGLTRGAVQPIRNASNEFSAARKEMMRAYNRLNDFLSHGVVPEDLKRHG